MDIFQRPDLRQKVTLSPQVYQGLNILALPITELQQLIEAEILENPVLEVDELELELMEDEPVDKRHDSEEDRAWDDWLEMYDELNSGEATTLHDPDVDRVNTEEYIGGLQTFNEYLIAQLGMLDISDEVHRAASVVIGLLDRDGYFVGDCAEVAALADVSLEVAKEGLRVVQQLDPPGVGATSLAEALCLQMEHLGINEPLLEAIVHEHLPDIAASHFRKIARALKVDETEVRRVVELLRTLNPRPAGAFSSGPSPGYIVPDVTVRRFGEEWLIMSNNESIPSLRVSPRYRAMLRAGSIVDEDTMRYLKDKIRSAENFIRNIDRRKDTVSRITEIILEVQRDFFEDGKGPLRPLRLEDVAVELGVHLSTVSRGVTGKYMATPYGLFELKHFFSGGYRMHNGMDVASTSVKQRLRAVVAEEDPVKPYSDQKLVEILRSEGITVARRTVAKYREELGIEPSWARKRR